MLTLQEVIESIDKSKKMKDFMGVISPENRLIFDNFTSGHFEAVLSGKGNEKYLIPEETFSTYLYRGQNIEFIPCIPTLYRNNPSEVEIFLNRMRLVVFKHLLNSYPIINGFFKKNHFFIDVEGLAQHYGLKTSVLDLTNSLEVALFFATCYYDKSSNKYEYYVGNNIHHGILYVFDPYFDNEPVPPLHTEFLNGNIRPIGLQPFRRPAVQKGFSLRIKKGDSVKCYIYRFTFSSEDSKHYYDKFEGGSKLFIQDDIADKTLAISKLLEFSYKTFDETYSLFRPKGYSKTKLKKLLKNNLGVLFNSKLPYILFSKDESKKIVDKWNVSEGEKVANSIVQKCTIERSGTDKNGNPIFSGKKTEFRTLRMLSLKNFIATLYSPGGPLNSTWVNYTNTPAPQRSSKGEIEVIPASGTEVFGKPYLKEEDWKINN